MVAAAANPKTKVAKKGDSSADVSMGKESTGGVKRPPRTDSDPDRDSVSDGFPSVADVTPAPAAAGSSASNPAASLEAIFAKFDTRLTVMQDASALKLDQLANSITTGLLSVTNKIDSHVLATDAKIANLQEQISAITAGLATPRSFAAAAGSAASSGHPPAAHAAPAPRVAATGPDEACLVFIRGFPVVQPGIVLREYAEEALEFLPALERALVRMRISPADSQFSLVFPSPASAKAFVEDYSARKFVFEDCDKAMHPLTCRTGKPLALRRRGGLIMPIYALLSTILSRTRGLTTATISQVSKQRGAATHTEFYALVGKTLTPLFTLLFEGAPENLAITGFLPATNHCPLADADLTLLSEAAGLA
jgi:hypothetical protein